jgi:hypothetical protein
MFRILYDAGPAGLKQDEWHKRAREAGLGKSRPATLTDLRMDLKGKKLAHEFNGQQSSPCSRTLLHNAA